MKGFLILSLFLVIVLADPQNGQETNGDYVLLYGIEGWFLTFWEYFSKENFDWKMLRSAILRLLCMLKFIVVNLYSLVLVK